MRQLERQIVIAKDSAGGFPADENIVVKTDAARTLEEHLAGVVQN